MIDLKEWYEIFNLSKVTIKKDMYENDELHNSEYYRNDGTIFEKITFEDDELLTKKSMDKS